MDKDKHLLKLAIEQSRESVKQGAFPVGVVIAREDEVVVVSISDGKRLNDPTSHAEIAAIRDLCSRLGSRDLSEFTLYSSMEPCLMCYGACCWAGVRRVVYACGKTTLSPMHFEGDHALEELNSHTRRPIEIVHFDALEAEALQVIHDWEAVIVHILTPS